ncbi:MAG: DUF2971 domain-containing protein, partial [Sciscionella sp.]
HYTSKKFIKRNLENQCIFATDAAFLNDSSEILYAGRALQRHLKHLIGHINLSPPQPGSDERKHLSDLGQAEDWLAKFNNAEYYLEGSAWTVYDGATFVACFTEQPDQLSQWRGYGGRGYSIGFTREGLNQLVVDDGKDTPAGDLIKVSYEDEGLEKLLQDVSDYFEARSHTPFNNLGDIMGYMLPRMAGVKHKAFEEEKEWRLAVSRYLEPPRGIDFREGNRLVPYLKLQFDPSAVAFVYIGPGADIHDKRALRYFLARSGYNLDDVWIEHSNAPYRGG